MREGALPKIFDKSNSGVCINPVTDPGRAGDRVTTISNESSERRRENNDLFGKRARLCWQIKKCCFSLATTAAISQTQRERHMSPQVAGEGGGHRNKQADKNS